MKTFFFSSLFSLLIIYRQNGKLKEKPLIRMSKSSSEMMNDCDRSFLSQGQSAKRLLKITVLRTSSLQKKKKRNFTPPCTHFIGLHSLTPLKHIKLKPITGSKSITKKDKISIRIRIIRKQKNAPLFGELHYRRE